LVGEHLLFGRGEAVGVPYLGEEQVKFGWRFAADEQSGRAEPVGETVLAGRRFARGGAV
jgi:hypothetical protein